MLYIETQRDTKAAPPEAPVELSGGPEAMNIDVNHGMCMVIYA